MLSQSFVTLAADLFFIFFLTELSLVTRLSSRATSKMLRFLNLLRANTAMFVQSKTLLFVRLVWSRVVFCIQMFEMY